MGVGSSLTSIALWAGLFFSFPPPPPNLGRVHFWMVFYWGSGSFVVLSSFKTLLITIGGGLFFAVTQLTWETLYASEIGSENLGRGGGIF